MLWALLKVVIFIALVAGLTWGAGLLLEMGDLATLTVMGDASSASLVASL